MSTLKVKVRKLSKNAVVPERATDGAAGYDISSVDGPVVIAPHGAAILHTGICFQIPRGYYGQVACRSGLGFKYNVRAFAGVIDSDYRGELLIQLHNDGDESYTVGRLDKIAQLVILPYASFPTSEVDVLDETDRGANGFGSTGS